MRLIRPLLAGLLLGATSAFAAGPVDINQADAQTLARELNGVGPSKAMAIVEYRSKHGPFMSVEALSEVSGIGQRILELNRDRMAVTSPKP